MPRCLIFEPRGCDSLNGGVIVVGMNPVVADDDERDVIARLFGPGHEPERAYTEYLAWQMKAMQRIPFYTLMPAAVTTMGFVGPILWTELVKCESGEKIVVPGKKKRVRFGLVEPFLLTTVRTCRDEHLRTELALCPPEWPIVAASLGVGDYLKDARDELANQRTLLLSLIRQAVRTSSSGFSSWPPCPRTCPCANGSRRHSAQKASCESRPDPSMSIRANKCALRSFVAFSLRKLASGPRTGSASMAGSCYADSVSETLDLTAEEFARWLVEYAPDRLWGIDGEGRIEQARSLPCAGAELAAELRRRGGRLRLSGPMSSVPKQYRELGFLSPVAHVNGDEIAFQAAWLNYGKAGREWLIVTDLLAEEATRSAHAT